MKHRAWNKYKMNTTLENWDNYIRARNSETWEVKKAKQMYEKSLAINIKRNAKCFWNMVREKKPSMSRSVRLENNRWRYSH